MRCTTDFAAILEAELKCTDMPRAGHASAARNRPSTPPLFVFDVPRPGVHQSDGEPRHVARSRPQMQEKTSRPTEPPPSGPKRPLSARDERALMALKALGADLDDELSAGTLRRAFRRLARRYHPDRHPGCSVVERERLARLFAEATEHYRVLARSVRL